MTLDVVVADFAPEGAFSWKYTRGGPFNLGYDLAVASHDTIVVAGGWSESALFGDEERTSAGKSDIFAVGLTAGGKHRWHQTFRGVEAEQAEAVAVRPTGMVVVGSVQGPLDLGHGERPNAGYIDGFLVALQ